MGISNLILASSNPLSHVVQHELFPINIVGYKFVFTNHMMMQLVAATLLVIVLVLGAKNKDLVPRGLKNVVEGVCVFVRDQIAKPALGHNADAFLPYLMTVFVFILLMNLLGMIPFDGILYLISGGHLRHLGGTPTANIFVTGALASVAFVVIHVAGIKRQGLWHYIKNFIPKVPWPLIPMMYVLEIIGAFIKPFALAIRLFANMLAGHLVLATLMSLVLAVKSVALLAGLGSITVLACSALCVLELFIACLQAFIFTFLTAVFISLSVHPEH